jgi:fatty acid desaturase
LKFRDQNLSFEDVNKRIFLGLVVLTLFAFALCAFAFLVVWLFQIMVLLWQWLVTTGFPYIALHPLVIIWVMIAALVVLLAFFLGDSIIRSEQEQAEQRAQEKRIRNYENFQPKIFGK